MKYCNAEGKIFTNIFDFMKAQLTKKKSNKKKEKKIKYNNCTIELDQKKKQVVMKDENGNIIKSVAIDQIILPNYKDF